MRGPALWAFGAVLSLLAHIVLLPMLGLLVEPNSLTPQPSPETKVNLDTFQVDQQDAKVQPIQGDATDTRTTPGSELNASAIELSQLKARPPATQPAIQPTPRAETLSPGTATGDILAPGALQTDHTSAPASVPTRLAAQITPQSEPTTDLSVTPVKTAALNIPADVISSIAATATTSPALSTPSQPIASTLAIPAISSVTTEADASTLLAITAPAISRPSIRPATSKAPTVTAPSTQAPTQPAQGESTLPKTLPTELTKAALAWDFGDRTVTDAKSLAVIQAFLSPADLEDSGSNAGEVREGLSDVLSSVDCARLTATYIPETGALELRGHVPDDNLRAPVLAALQDQIGAGITVTDNLLLLPKPQCGALSRIADIGLPQSTEQLTNPLLIGNDAHAREFDFTEGQRLTFDLSAPDYDAVVYVDYFDAGGQVIHLAPNDRVPLEMHSLKSSFVVGSTNPDQPGLNITIGPPFGQEIAVAFASSTPLFDDLRPLIEPADLYLTDLKSAITKARADNPGFKGEWVYFFITTASASQ